MKKGYLGAKEISYAVPPDFGGVASLLLLNAEERRGLIGSLPFFPITTRLPSPTGNAETHTNRLLSLALRGLLLPEADLF